MELEYLQKKYAQLVGLVSKMRVKQIEAEKYKSRNYREKARLYEREVDKLIKSEHQSRNQLNMYGKES